MQSVCEFRLNYTKIHNSGHFGHSCTGTALTCTGIGCILLGCIGTALTCTGTGWLLMGGTGTALFQYRYSLEIFA